MEIVKKRRRPMAEINVVPYIDVMLVLLIVFMVTAPLLEQGLKVDLPEANSEPLDVDEVGKIVAANPQIQVFVEGDGESSYSSFISLMTVLQAAGVASPNLITKPLE